MSPTINKDIEGIGHETKNLKKTISVLVVTTIILVGSLFGVSIATARLSKEFTVDSVTGFATVPGTGQILKTEIAIHRNVNFSLVDVDNEILGYIQAITFEGGDIRFPTFGHSRDSVNNVVTMIVQGGTISFDAIGIKSATGDPALFLEEVGLLDSGTTRRMLSSGDGVNGFDIIPFPCPFPCPYKPPIIPIL